MSDICLKCRPESIFYIWDWSMSYWSWICWSVSCCTAGNWIRSLPFNWNYLFFGDKDLLGIYSGPLKSCHTLAEFRKIINVLCWRSTSQETNRCWLMGINFPRDQLIIHIFSRKSDYYGIFSVPVSISLKSRQTPFQSNTL